MSQNSQIHGRTVEEFNGMSGKWVPLAVNASGQIINAVSPGQLAQFNRDAGGAVAKYAVVSADQLVATGPAILYGIYCVSAGTMAAIYDNTAASGQALISSSALTAGQSVTYNGIGLLCTTGIFADWTSGTFLVMYVDSVV